MQWDCWHLLEGHMEKGGVLEVVTKNTACITGVFSATSANAGSPVSPDRPVTQGTAAPTLAPSQGASPDMRRTIVVPSPYHRRCILGFRLKAKSEHEATQVFGWYGDGRGMAQEWWRRWAGWQVYAWRGWRRVGGSRMAGVGGGRGNLRVAKTPPLQAALRGDRYGVCRTDHHLRPQASMGAANGGSRSGIGSGGHSRCSAPPLPSSLLIIAPCRLHAHTVHPENGAPSVFVAMRRVVVKTVGSPWVGGVKADNDAARRVATSFEERENRF